METILEEIVIECMPHDGEAMLTATLLEHAIASNGDLWGLLQPYAHLNAGRIASGKMFKKEIWQGGRLLHNAIPFTHNLRLCIPPTNQSLIRREKGPVC